MAELHSAWREFLLTVASELGLDRIVRRLAGINRDQEDDG